MKRYDNGDLIIADRIENEPWYPDYQAMMEIACYLNEKPSVEKILELFDKDYKNIFNKDYTDKEQAIRWAVPCVARWTDANFPSDRLNND